MQKANEKKCNKKTYQCYANCYKKKKSNKKNITETKNKETF